jgi:hypothetical protein
VIPSLHQNGRPNVSDAFASRSASAPYGTSGNEGRSDYGRGSSFESSTRGRSAEGIQRDAEAARSGIADTLDELKDRFNPESALQYGSDYIRGPGGQRLLRAARENPMAAALALAGIGWLLYTANRSGSPRRGGSMLRQGETGPRYTGATSTENSQVGVLGDGTQEQNLNQPGQAGTRITRDEVKDAFGSDGSLNTSIR